MATILLDKTLCIVCGEAINEYRPFVAFSAFVVDENDPIFIFSDSACHDDCLAKHDLVDIVTERYREWESNTGPGNRSCVECKEEILDPDDYIMIDHLASDDISISRYNYTHLHRSHVAGWADLDDALAKIKVYRESSNWGGGYLEYLVTSLEEEKQIV